MDFTDHDKSIARIESWIKEDKSWEEIRMLSFFPSNMNFEERMGVTANMNSFEHKYTKEEWEQLINHLKRLEKPTVNVVNKLATGTRNDAQIAQSSRSAWQLYKKKLFERNWNKESIDGIEKSAHQILQMLDDDTENKEPVKGLVLGNVQSGKTANMA